DAFKTDALGAELGDLPQLAHVAHRISAGLSRGAAGADETHPVVLPEGLRVHSAEFGGGGDGEERGLLIHQLFAFDRRSARGFSSGSVSTKASSFFFASALRWLGTATCTVASRSPTVLPVFTPRPLTRSTRPLGVP